MRRYLVLIVGSLVSIGLDQWSKIAAVKALVLPNGQLPEDAAFIQTKIHVVLEAWFNFKVAGNKGAAWGLFRNMPETWRVPFFVLISVIAVAVIVHLYRKAHDQPVLQWALTMILGGAVGNLIDRIAYGFVVDFIDWHYNGSHWPTFNIADVAISVGVGLLLIDMLLQGRHKREAKETAKMLE